MNKSFATVIAVIAVTVAATLAITGCHADSTVTGKHPCRQHGKPAYCLTESTGHFAYVPYNVWRAARIGDDVSDEGHGSVSIAHPAEGDGEGAHVSVGHAGGGR